MVSAALVGQVIQSYRLRKGMSQEVLSGLAGLDRTHYSKIERGLRSPTLDTLFKIAQALDIPPSDIVRQIELDRKPAHAPGGVRLSAENRFGRGAPANEIIEPTGKQPGWLIFLPGFRLLPHIF